MFNTLIEFFRSAIIEQIVGDPVWATAALIGQLIFGGRFSCLEAVKCRGIFAENAIFGVTSLAT